MKKKRRTKRPETPDTLCRKSGRPVVLYDTDRGTDFRAVRHVESFKDHTRLLDSVEPAPRRHVVIEPVKLAGERCEALVQNGNVTVRYDVCGIAPWRNGKFMVQFAAYDKRARRFVAEAVVVPESALLFARKLT